jgi:endonuclease YncB( thermonuclease family)
MKKNYDQYYYYLAEVVRVIDGDSVVLFVDLGFGITIKTSVRLFGVNAPELNSEDLTLRELAKNAKERLSEMLPPGTKVSVVSHKRKGRYVAELTHLDEGFDPAKLLVEEGLAVDISERA